MSAGFAEFFTPVCTTLFGSALWLQARRLPLHLNLVTPKRCDAMSRLVCGQHDRRSFVFDGEHQKFCRLGIADVPANYMDIFG